MYKMKEKFYWDVIEYLVEEITPVMHCKTEEEANWFLGILHENGLKWSSGDSYLTDSKWHAFKENTCYNFTEGMYCSFNYLCDIPNYAILECSDYMEYVGDDACGNATEESNKMDSKKEVIMENTFTIELNNLSEDDKEKLFEIVEKCKNGSDKNQINPKKEMLIGLLDLMAKLTIQHGQMAKLIIICIVSETILSQKVMRILK